MKYLQWIECSGATPFFHLSKTVNLSGLRVEIDNFMIRTYTMSFDTYISFDDECTLMHKEGTGDIGIGIGSGITLTADQFYNIVMTNTSLTDGTQTVVFEHPFTGETSDIYINCLYDGVNWDFNAEDCVVRYGEIRIYEYDTLICRFRPCEFDGYSTFYETVSKTMLQLLNDGITSGPEVVVNYGGYEYFRMQNSYFQIPVTRTINTRVECDNMGMITNNGDSYPGLFCIGNEWDNSTISIASLSSPNWIYAFGGDRNATAGKTYTYGERYNISIQKNKLVIGNNEYTLNTSTLTSNSKPLTIGGRNDTNTDNVIRMMDGYAGNFRLYDGNVIVGDYRPCVKDGKYCYYDYLNNVYYEKLGSGTIEAINPLHVFNPSQSQLKSQSIANTKQITVTSQTGWTATTNNSWLSVYPSNGISGITNVAISIADGNPASARTGSITFTDTDTYSFDVFVHQTKLGIKVYTDRYKIGLTQVNKQQRGSDNVNKMYMGGDLIYQKLSFAPSLSINVDYMEFKYSGDTAQMVNVNSNTDWTYSASTDWLTITRSGNTLSILPQNYTSELEDRTATVTLTADNGDMKKTKTISVLQKRVMVWEALDYVYTTSDAYIRTYIKPTTSTKFRVKLKTTGTNGGKIVGFNQYDRADYRLFNYSGLNNFTWDFNDSRITAPSVSADSNGLYDLTVGNNYVYNNVAGATSVTGATQSEIFSPDESIQINLNNLAQIQQVTIYSDNDTVVFDGHAAEYEGEYGIYDTITETLLQPFNGATVYKGTW